MKSIHNRNEPEVYIKSIALIAYLGHLSNYNPGSGRSR